ncbi:hypothetical protein [Thermaerobacter litoralis]
MPEKVTFTLHIEPAEGHAEMASFARVIERFSQLLHEIENTLDPRRRKHIPWIISEISQGSYVVTAEASEDTDLGREVIRSAVRGLRQLQQLSEFELPATYSGRALVLIKEIAREAVRQNGQITVHANGMHAVISRSTLDAIRRMMAPPPFKDYGSVEGSLEMVSIRQAFRCNIYRDFDGRRVECHFKEDLLPIVKEALAPGQRVIVAGNVAYDEDGEVKSIIADSIEILPKAEELPDPIYFLGLVPDFTDGMPSEDFVRRLRDEG